MHTILKGFALCFIPLQIFSSSISGAEVNILSERQEFLLRPFLEVFEEQTGIETNVVYLKKGSLERLKHQPGAVDLLLTVDIANLTAIADAGLLQPHGSKLLKNRIPFKFQDPRGRWVALTARARVIFYALSRVDPHALSTYEALAEPEFNGKVCMRSGYHNYNVALISAMISALGESKTLAWLRGLKSNLARRPQGNDRAQVKAIYHGQCDVALGNTYYMGKMLEREDQREWAQSVGIFFPDQQGRGTHMNISGGAIVSGAKNRAQAVKLLEFLSGGLAQYMYAEVNHEYPVIEGVALSGIVRKFGAEQPGIENGVFKQDSLPLTEIGKNRRKAILLLDQAGFDL